MQVSEAIKTQLIKRFYEWLIRINHSRAASNERGRCLDRPESTVLLEALLEQTKSENSRSGFAFHEYVDQQYCATLKRSVLKLAFNLPPFIQTLTSCLPMLPPFIRLTNASPARSNPSNIVSRT